MRRMTEEYSSPFQMWMGGNLLIGIYDPQQAKHILRNRNCIDKSIMYKLAEPLFGMGLLTAPASIWTRIRKIAAFTFSPSMLQNFFKIFVEESEILVHQLQKNDLNGNEIDLHDHISNCSWRMACGSLMGIKLEQEKNKEYVKAIQRLKNNIIYRVRNKLFFDCIFYITALGRNHKKDTDFINSLSDEMIQQLTHDLNNPNTKDGNSRTHRTFFEILTEASRKNNFTREEIHDNVMTMLLGANDTITSLINFVTFLLGSFPEVQEKVYKELCEIYGTKSTKDAPVMYEDLQYMCYLDGVIKETMRIFPTVPLISRKATKDIKIGLFFFLHSYLNYLL
ncbi:PREDICTED: cytochrome P450 4V2-like [Vollenhovia emeryi]|uniref:cytochrome P450 4V2-like n=1 Tax=Vollenhovia emeryi TaxID=411798 RepID=UPI0005F37C90|nr:PREDICTED: cytochrome P450 4V2-like [Vollenhovia emeryi]